MILQCSIEMPNISYAWKEPKEQLGEDIDSKVKGMVFLEGRSGVCLDIPTASVAAVQKRGVMRGTGCILWPWSNQSENVHGKDIATSEDSGKATEASGDSARVTEVPGDSGKEVEASEDSDQEVATKVTDFKTKARNGVLIKHLDSNLK